MEGTRVEAKYSVAAIAASAGASNQSVFSDLYNVYMHNLLLLITFEVSLQLFPWLCMLDSII